MTQTRHGHRCDPDDSEGADGQFQRLRLGSFDQIRGIIDEELEGIWSGDKTAQEAMDSAKERGDALLRRFEAANR